MVKKESSQNSSFGFIDFLIKWQRDIAFVFEKNLNADISWLKIQLILCNKID